MKSTVTNLATDFIANRDAIKEAFSMESVYMIPVCAAVFTDKGKLADVRQLKECNRILKEKTGAFSGFRGTAKLSMIAMMGVAANPEILLQNSIMVYGALKEYFWGSAYLPVASMILAEAVEPHRYHEAAAKAKEIYEMMKKEHPFLTSSEDSVFAVLLALSNRSTEEIVEETETCYKLLKTRFSSSNAVQSLSHVLALGDGDAARKCQRTIDLYEKLQKSGCKYGTSYELATLGVLALIPDELEEIVREVVAVDAFLAEQKGYGVFGPGKKQRLMHAGMIVTSGYTREQESPVMSTAAIGGTISLIAAQQAAMCAAIAASAAASSASS